METETLPAGPTTLARALGLYDRGGSIGPGKNTDLVLLDEHPELEMVTSCGECDDGACR